MPIQRRPMQTLLALCLVGSLAGCGMGRVNLRAPGGALAPCDGGPHCVSSKSEDPDRRVEPLTYTGKREDVRRHLLAVLGAREDLTVVESQPDYIRAEARTAIMRYVDDLEFVFAAREARIDVRSSSRVGWYDFGVNRRRIEAIRADFQKY